jgi:hypothetical protein
MEDRFIRISEAEAAFDATTEQVAAGLVEYLKDKFMYWTPGAPPPSVKGKPIVCITESGNMVMIPQFDPPVIRWHAELSVARWMEIKA